VGIGGGGIRSPESDLGNGLEMGVCVGVSGEAVNDADGCRLISLRRIVSEPDLYCEFGELSIVSRGGDVVAGKKGIVGDISAGECRRGFFAAGRVILAVSNGVSSQDPSRLSTGLDLPSSRILSVFDCVDFGFEVIDDFTFRVGSANSKSSSQFSAFAFRLVGREGLADGDLVFLGGVHADAVTFSDISVSIWAVIFRLEIESWIVPRLPLPVNSIWYPQVILKHYKMGCRYW